MQLDQEVLAPKEEPQDDVEYPHAEEQRVEVPTHVDTSKDGKKHTKEDDRLILYAREDVVAPTS